MKKLYIPVGLPGSGKSTILWKDLKEEFPCAVRVSPDDFRRLLLDSYKTGIFFDKTTEPHVWRTVYTELTDYCKKSMERIFFDATHLTWRSRWNVANIGKRHGYHVTVLHIFIDPKLCFLRNSKREYPVPHESMVDMMKTYKSPRMKSETLIDEIQQIILNPSKKERIEMRTVKWI